MAGHFLYGRGPVHSIALHGWLGDWRVFEPMVPALDPKIYSIAFLDARGYGASKALAGPFDLDTVAVDALQLADKLGWASFSLIGHSMGGKAALRIATLAPARVTRILALTPVWAGGAPFDDDTLAFFRGASADVGTRVAILHNTTGGRYPAAWSSGLAARSAEVSAPEAFAGYFEFWALVDFAAGRKDPLDGRRPGHFFTLVTALMFHTRFSDPPQMVNFMKNIALIGGFLQMMAFGAGAFSVDGWLAARRPRPPA